MFFDSDLGRPMLFQDSIKDDESGNGFALRMAVANELMFCDLTRAFASIGHRYLPASAAKKIAYMFGANPNQVIRSMPQTFKRNGNLVTSLMGNEFQRTFLVRATRPQICTQCLEHLQRTLVVWDLSLVTTCPLHKIKLTDVCPNCSKFLRWRRPDLYTCFCGFDYRQSKAERGSDECVWLSQHIQHLFTGAPPLYYGNMALDNKFRVLVGFNLDILMRVIRALGLSIGLNTGDIVPGRVTKVLSTQEAVSVVNRAFARLSGLTLNSGADLNVFSLHTNDLLALRDQAQGIEQAKLSQLFNILSVFDSRYVRLGSDNRQLSLF